MFDRAALRELYDYTEFTWAAYAKAIARLPDGAFTKPVAGSGWPSLADSFRHVVGAYDGWLHERLGAGAVVVPDTSVVSEWPAFEDWRRNVRATARRLIEDTPDDGLLSQTTNMWDVPGRETGFLVSIADVVAHVLLHERGHHGDISTLLSQLGVEAPAMDYGVYLFFKRSAEGSA